MPAFATVMVVMIAGLQWSSFRSDQPDGQMADMALPEALVFEFATFIASGRDFDIASSDTQTLKTWFESRMDEPPPPGPPVEATMRLAGGRLCQIQNNRVASYAYRLDDVLVSLYITKLPGPTREVSDTPDAHELTISAQADFAYASWDQTGWRYSLVAELPARKVEEIATLLSIRLREQKS